MRIKILHPLTLNLYGAVPVGFEATATPTGYDPELGTLYRFCDNGGCSWNVWEKVEGTAWVRLPKDSGAEGARPAAPANPKQLYGDAKVPLHLVPSAGIVYEALAFKEGARKYGPYNWRDNSVEAMTYIGAALRHIYAYLDGEDLDPEADPPTPHLGMARACLGILADATETGNLIDNRPKKGAASRLLAHWKKPT